MSQGTAGSDISTTTTTTTTTTIIIMAQGIWEW